MVLRAGLSIPKRAVEQTVVDLVAGQWDPRFGQRRRRPPQLGLGVVADTHAADATRLHLVGQAIHQALDAQQGEGPVHQVEVDAFQTQASQTRIQGTGE